MYDFCLRKLHLGESSAVRHIAAARACSRFPAALKLIREGQLNLTGLELVSRYLTAENHAELSAAALGRRKSEIEAMLRAHFPRPDVPECVRPVTPQHRFEVAPDQDAAQPYFGAPVTLERIDGMCADAPRARGRVALGLPLPRGVYNHGTVPRQTGACTRPHESSVPRTEEPGVPRPQRAAPETETPTAPRETDPLAGPHESAGAQSTSRTPETLRETAIVPRTADRAVLEKLYAALRTMGFRATETKAALAKLGERSAARETAMREQKSSFRGHHAATLETLLREALALLSLCDHFALGAAGREPVARGSDVVVAACARMPEWVRALRCDGYPALRRFADSSAGGARPTASCETRFGKLLRFGWVGSRCELGARFSH